MRKVERPADPFDKGRKKLPWVANRNDGVPPAMRTYCFMFDEGSVGVVEERFVHSVNPIDNTRSVRKLIGPNTKFVLPRTFAMTFSEVEKLYAACAVADEPLRVCFTRLFRERLSVGDVAFLAQSPDMWVHAPGSAVETLSVAEKASTADFLKLVDGEPKISAPSAQTQAKTKKLEAVGI